MKKIIVTIYFLFLLFRANAQNKNFVVNNYVIQFDTTTKIFEKYSVNSETYNYSCFTSGYSQRLFDCKEGKIFLFSDTLTTSDASQIGTTGVFRITVHNALINTTKRNIFIPASNILLSWDNNTQYITMGTDDGGGWPIIIRNRSTNVVSVSIGKNGEMLFDVVPTNITTFGNIKKVVVN